MMDGGSSGTRNTRDLGFLLLALCCLAGPCVAAGDDAFVDVTGERGIAFTSVNGATGKKYLIESMVAGAAWLDYDGDGFQDLYLIQAHSHPERALDGPGGKDQPSNRLYRNTAGRGFEDVTAATGTGDRGYGMGVAVGDFDGDGWPDIYVNNYGRNTLYRNVEDGDAGGRRFEDVTAQAGVEGDLWSSSATFADLDGDGHLDLYVASYLDYDTRKDGACDMEVSGTDRTVPGYCHPKYFVGAQDILYRNKGDGTFENASKAAGLRASGLRAGKGLGVLASDFDRDGDLDVFVANDTVNNNLWRNDGTGRFEDAAFELGFALNADGSPEAGMGLARGDVNGDGSLDYFVTNFSRETNTLYLNYDGFLEDSTIEVGLARGGYLPLGFGAVLLDFDLDGDLDVYVANGHVLDNIELLNPGEAIPYRQPDLLFANAGRGRFRDASKHGGMWFEQALVGRSVAVGDYDNDGDPDLVVTHVGGPAVLLENRAGNGKNWIGLDLATGSGQKVVHNAWVELRTEGGRRVHEVQTDGSYAAAHDPRVRFALPAGVKQVDARVTWLGGASKTYGGLAAGRYHRVRP